MVNEEKQLDQTKIPDKTEELKEYKNLEFSGETGLEESNEEDNGEDFSSWTKQELFDKLKEIIQQDKIEENNTAVFSIKDFYRSQVQVENEERLKNYLASGGLSENFTGVRSEMDESFEEFIKRFNKRRKEIKVQKEKGLILNFVVKKQIIEDLKQLAQTSENLSKAFDKFHELQDKWRETGKVPAAEGEELWQNYRFYVDQFFNTVNLNKELRDLDRTKNIELKTALCERAEKLSAEPIVKRAVLELRKLQDDWKDVGFIPKEESDSLWERFKIATNKIYDRQKEQSEKLKTQLEDNLKAKVNLCLMMEKLLESLPDNHKGWKTGKEKVEEVMQQWKKIGYVPKADKGETWEKFKSLRKQFFKEKDLFYSKLKEDQSENLKIKIALCEKAEALKDNTDWEKTANELKRLQQEWKKSGPVPLKQSDKIWKRFRTACDTFFDNKNKVKDAEQSILNDNLQKRKEIIQNLNNLEISDDKETNMKLIKDLQNEFNEAGEVSLKDDEALVKNFNKSLDGLLNRIKEKTGGKPSEFFNLRFESLIKTEDGKNTIRKERKIISEKIKHLQTEVMQLENNVSFFGKSKNAEAMLSDFHGKINDGKVKIKKLQEELERMPRV